MNTNTVCLFPDTMPRAEVLFPLVQVFDPIVYLRAVEDDNPDTDALSELCREMTDQGLVRYDCPAPLAENRDRFLALINDLQHRRDDYAGQLSNLSLAGLGSRKTESKTTIISTLLKQTGIENSRDEQLMQVLWQARLVLKLGENFDIEQAELQQNLERISARENGMIKELREEAHQPFSLTMSLSAADAQTDGQLRLRLKAWSRLFGLGDKRISAGGFITTSRDSFDLLLEQYEQIHHVVPQPMLNLLLPCLQSGVDFVRQRTAFQDEAAELVKTCRKILAEPAQVTGKDRIKLDGTESQWAELVEKYYPAAEYPRCTLTLSHLPAVEVSRLFLETFGRDEDEIQKTSREQPAGAVIGILES